jgi:outer membrane receptor protein involved in Fe transport
MSVFLGSAADSMRAVERNVLTWALGGRAGVTDRLVLRATFGRFPRVPTFAELFGDTGDLVGNTELAAETSYNADIGAHYELALLAGEIDATLFHRRAEDLIQRRSYGEYMTYENIGKAAVTGLESWARLALWQERVHVRGAVAYQRALNKSDETAFRKRRYYDKRLPYRPDWQIDLSARYRARSWASLIWKTDFETESYTGPSNLDEETVAARAIHDLELRLVPRPGVQVRLETENLTNERAVDRTGYPKPGRAFHVGLRWTHEL